MKKLDPGKFRFGLEIILGLLLILFIFRSCGLEAKVKDYERRFQTIDNSVKKIETHLSYRVAPTNIKESMKTIKEATPDKAQPTKAK